MAKAKILVVEDEAGVALELRNRLISLGYTVAAVVSSGEEAVQKAAETHPDLVLMDIRLKGELDGVQATEQIRALFDIPVVYMGADRDEPTSQRAELAEPFGYLLKPLEERELHTIIEMALCKHEIEKKLKENERWLASTLNCIGDGVIITDAQGRIKFMNPAAEVLTGWAQEESLDKDLREVFRAISPQTRFPTENSAIRALQERALVDPGDYALFLSKDEMEIPIDDRAALIKDDHGNITGAVLILQDRSEQVRAEERLEAIYQLGRELTLLYDESAVFDQVLRTAARVLRFDRARYGLIDKATEELEYNYYRADGTPEAIRLRLSLEEEQDIGVAVACSGQAINMSLTGQGGHPLPLPEFQFGLWELCVPMKAGERVIGVLALESFEQNRFSSDDQQLLQTLADQAAVALESAHLYDEIRQRVAQLTTLNQISQAINASLDLQETLTMITDHATRLLGVAAASVVLSDQTKGGLWFAAASGKGADFVHRKQLAMDKGIVGWVVRYGQPVLVPDVSQDSRFFANFDQESSFTTRSILCVPLQTQGRTIGAIEVMNKESGPFDQEDLRLLTSLAAPAAIAIENARLHAETERRAEQLVVLHELDRIVTASLRITDVYHALARHAGRLLSYDRLSISLIEGDEVRVAYVVDEDESSPSVGITLPLRTSSVGWVAARGQPLLRHNIASDTRFPGDQPLTTGGIQSAMIMPLWAKGRVIGTCNIGCRQVGAYSPDDLVTAQSMADQLAIAIENARLFEAEQRARQTAEILRAANLAFTQTLDLDAVLGALLDYLRQFIPYDSASVMLVEEDSRVVVRATRGYENWTDLEQIGTVTTQAESSPIIHDLLTARESLLIPDTYEYPGWERRAGGELARNWLGVPLVLSGEVIGLCSINKSQAGYFTEAHRRLAESLTAQAAIAIQNARLFEQVRLGRERLQTLSRRLVEVQETERHHIARELHDQAGQALTSLMVGLRLLEEKAGQGGDVAAHVAELKCTVDGVSEGLHRLATDLRPASLDHLGLVEALRQHVEAFGRQHDLVVQFEAVGIEGKRLSPTQETALFRIVQEALTNVVRHAHATRADVLLERQSGRVIAIVEDDGLGFEPEVAMQSGRLGLLGMRERAEMLGGSLTVESSPGAGATLFVEVPYVHSHPDR